MLRPQGILVYVTSLARLSSTLKVIDCMRLPDIAYAWQPGFIACAEGFNLNEKSVLTVLSVIHVIDKLGWELPLKAQGTLKSP